MLGSITNLINPVIPPASAAGTGILDFSLIAEYLNGTLPTPDAQGNITLGTFTFTAGPGTGTGTINAIVDSSQLGNAFSDGNPSNDNDPFDSLVNPGSAPVTITAGSVMPEPASWLTAATGSVLWMGYYWRGRRAIPG